MDPIFAAVILLSLIFSLCVHEAAHAAMATYCGDDTAKLKGRLSLNPLVHIDPLGSIIMPLILLTMNTGFIFGWAKPVPFNPNKLNNIRRDQVLIAMAGPASNLALALLFCLIGRIVSMSIGLDATPDLFLKFLYFTIMINLVLMIFNLIPVPPLDGHYALNYFLPPQGQRIMQQIGPFGILIAILVAQPILGTVLGPLMRFMMLMVAG